MVYKKRLRRKALRQYKKMRAKDYEAIQHASAVLTQLREEKKGILEDERIINDVKDHLRYIWPTIARLRNVAKHVIETDKRIQQLKKDLQDNKSPLSKRSIQFQKEIYIIDKLRKQKQHEEVACYSLAKDINSKMPPFRNLITQLENMEGIGEQLAKTIRDQFKKVEEECKNITRAWRIELKIEAKD